MKPLRPYVFLFWLLLGLSPGVPGTTAQAEGYYRLETRAAFLRMIEGRRLRQFGRWMRFDDLGQIKGRVWGRPLLGNWYWQEDQLCMRVFHGTGDQGETCGGLRFDGANLLFVPDKGAGDRQKFVLD